MSSLFFDFFLYWWRANKKTSKSRWGVKFWF